MADISVPTVGPAGPQNGTGIKLFGDDSVPAAVAAAGKDVQTQASSYADTLDQVGKGLSEISAAKVKNATDTAAAHEAINAGVEQSTRDLLDRARPVFARQAAVDARRQEVSTMNPFKRAILGFVNPNYSQTHLDHLAEVGRSEAADIGQEYQTTSALSDRLYQIASQRGGDAEAILNAKGSELDSSMSIAANRLQAARAKFGDQTNLIQADAEARRAQQLAGEQAISGLTLDQFGPLMAQAHKNGFAVVGGAQLSMGQLQERQTQLRSQALELESHQLAVSAGKINLANASEERMVMHMSPTDALQAAQNGGKYHGMQLPMDVLARRVASDASRMDTMSGMAAIQGQASVSTGIMHSFVDQMDGVRARAQSVFGNRVPPSIVAFMNGKAQEMQNLATQLGATTDKGTKQKILSDWAPKMAAWGQQVDKMIENTVGGMTRNKSVATVMHGWLTGSPVEGGDMVRGIVGMIESGGMPKGVNLSGPDGVAFKAAQAAYSSAANAVDGKGNPLKGPAREAYIMDRVSSAMSGAYANAKTNDILNSIPGFAKATGHPFAGVTPHDFAAARTAGDQTGLKMMAGKLGISTTELQLLLGSDSNPQGRAILQKVTGPDASNKDYRGATRSSIATELNSAQIAGTLDSLDHGPAARPGFIPSRAYSNLVMSPQFLDAANSHLDRFGQGSFGGYVSEGVSQGAVRNHLYNYGSNVQMAQGQLEANRTAAYVENMRAYGGDPVRRAGAILASVPGIDQHSQAVLMEHVRQIAQTAPQGMTAGDAVTAFIHGQGGKFQNPQLEKMRQIAAKHWDDASGRTDRAMAAIQQRSDNPRGKLGLELSAADGIR